MPCKYSKITVSIDLQTIIQRHAGIGYSFSRWITITELQLRYHRIQIPEVGEDEDLSFQNKIHSRTAAKTRYG